MQHNKKLYRDFYSELLASPTANTIGTLRRFLHEQGEWHGPHPIAATHGPEAVAKGFWSPLLAAFPNLSKTDDILMCGAFEGRQWVAATGHYSGRFEHDWLGIPASNTEVNIRFGEFVRIENNRICEARTLFDLVSLCRQLGIGLLPPDRGSMETVPAPETGDGVMLDPIDPALAKLSLKLVEEMIDGLLEFDGVNLDSMGMERFWTEDMRWYGPGGIGTTFGLDGFQKHHQRPFLDAFPDRTAAPHAALIAEGNYVSVTGWPSVIGTHAGNYLLAPASNRKVGMRVMDFWRNQNGRLAENWVLIDMLDLFMQLGYDLLGDALEKA